MGLKKYTAKATDISKMNVFGGAVFPFLQGNPVDALESRHWFRMLAVFCELIIYVWELVNFFLEAFD